MTATVSFTATHTPWWGIFTAAGEVLGWTVCATERAAWVNFADRNPSQWREIRELARSFGYYSQELRPPAKPIAIEPAVPWHEPIVRYLRRTG